MKCAATPKGLLWILSWIDRRTSSPKNHPHPERFLAHFANADELLRTSCCRHRSRSRASTRRATRASLHSRTVTDHGLRTMMTSSRNSALGFDHVTMSLIDNDYYVWYHELERERETETNQSQSCVLFLLRAKVILVIKSGDAYFRPIEFSGAENISSNAQYTFRYELSTKRPFHPLLKAFEQGLVSGHRLSGIAKSSCRGDHTLLLNKLYHLSAMTIFLGVRLQQQLLTNC